MLINVILGVAATVLASLQLTSWIALGSFLFNRRNGYDYPVPAAVVTGAASTGAVLAVLCWLGFVHVAVAVSALLSTIALVVRRRFVVEELRSAANQSRAAFAEVKNARWLVAVTLLVAWVLAIAPPRDADVLRYHLAHV